MSIDWIIIRLSMSKHGQYAYTDRWNWRCTPHLWTPSVPILSSFMPLLTLVLMYSADKLSFYGICMKHLKFINNHFLDNLMITKNLFFIRGVYEYWISFKFLQSHQAFCEKEYVYLLKVRITGCREAGFYK